jgi:signal transduction histidine kinase
VDIAIIILALICIANLFLGLFILVRNPAAPTGQIFFTLSVLVSAWAVCNYLTDNADQLWQNDLFNRLSFLFGFLALTASAAFSYVFTGQKLKNRNLALSVILLVPLMSLLSITSYVAGTVKQTSTGLVFTSGSLVFLYVAAVFLFLLVLVRNFYGLATHGDRYQRNQAKIIAYSFGVCIVGGMLTNVILPALSDNFQTAKLGPPFLSVCLIAGISYAIIKHQLFDIRPIVARSFAYVLSFLSIAAAYSVIVFGVASNFFNSTVSGGQKVFYVVFTIAIALTFQPISKAFSKIANRIFLRDYYEPQEVLDRLSSLLVGSVDIDDIETKSAAILKDALRAEFVRFYLKSVNTTAVPHELLKHLAASKKEIILLDEVDPHSHSNLYRLMSENNIALAARLRTRHEELGFLVFGYKRSGTPYIDADSQLVKIVAGEIAVGLQNALRFKEIRQFNVTLQEKVDDATKQLRHANSRLRELDQTKDEFISMASHQLRTPLTTIKGYLSMVLEGDVGPVSKNEKKMIQQAFDSAERMVFLIGDLLNISRLQSGKFVIENKPTDLAKMVEVEVSQLQETAKNHHLTLKYKKPEKLPSLNLDDTKIRQVVMNFLDNAIYYTPAGGSIEAVLEQTDGEIRFTVNDTGLGVPAAEQHHLFSKFYRAGNARKMRPDGTGLGLFMAKKVITAQGGAIIFKSTEGKGSTFGFSFPRHSMEVKDLKPIQPKKKEVETVKA